MLPQHRLPLSALHTAPSPPHLFSSSYVCGQHCVEQLNFPPRLSREEKRQLGDVLEELSYPYVSFIFKLTLLDFTGGEEKPTNIPQGL